MFIELTGDHDGAEIDVNVSLIKTIKNSFDDTRAIIFFVGDDEYTEVRETREEIKRLLKKKQTGICDHAFVMKGQGTNPDGRPICNKCGYEP